MSMFFNSITSKVLAVLFAIILPFSTLAPAIPNSTKAAAPKASIVYRANEKAVDEYRAEAEKANRYTHVNAPAEVTATEDEEEAPVADGVLPTGDETGAPAPAPEGTLEDVAGVDATATDNEGAPEKSWDISNGENDNVQMHYYAPEEDNSIIDNIGAAIKAIFTPITAYAADATVEEGGKVVIEGEGETEAYIFMNWLDFDKFVPYYEAYCAENGYDAIYIARENIDDTTGEYLAAPITALEAEADYATIVDGERVVDYEAMFKAYVPYYMIDVIYEVEDFWGDFGKFRPTEIEINGDVTMINFAAFAFCTSVTKVTINADLLVIAAGAFAHTAITRIDIPASLVAVGDMAFADCYALREVFVYGEVNYVGEDVFNNINNEDLAVYCFYKTTYNAAIGNGGATMMAMEGEDEAPEAEEEVYLEYNHKTDSTRYRVVYIADIALLNEE